MGGVRVSVAFLLTAMACPKEDTPAGKTWMSFHYLRERLDAFRDSTGTLPTTLQELCSSFDCDLPLDMGRFQDGWKHPLVYRQIDEEYEIRSWGADGVESLDDLVVRPSAERRVAQLVGGCYLGVVPWVGSGQVNIRLDTLKIGADAYHAHAGTEEMIWFIREADTLEIRWMVPLAIRKYRVGRSREGDSLGGTAWRYGGESSKPKEQQRVQWTKVECLE